MALFGLLAVLGIIGLGIGIILSNNNNNNKKIYNYPATIGSGGLTSTGGPDLDDPVIPWAPRTPRSSGIPFTATPATDATGKLGNLSRYFGTIRSDPAVLAYTDPGQNEREGFNDPERPVEAQEDRLNRILGNAPGSISWMVSPEEQAQAKALYEQSLGVYANLLSQSFPPLSPSKIEKEKQRNAHMLKVGPGERLVWDYPGFTRGAHGLLWWDKTTKANVLLDDTNVRNQCAASDGSNMDKIMCTIATNETKQAREIALRPHYPGKDMRAVNQSSEAPVRKMYEDMGLPFNPSFVPKIPDSALQGLMAPTPMMTAEEELRQSQMVKQQGVIGKQGRDIYGRIRDSPEYQALSRSEIPADQLGLLKFYEQQKASQAKREQFSQEQTAIKHAELQKSFGGYAGGIYIGDEFVG